VFAVVSKFLPPTIVPTTSPAAEDVAPRAFIDR
jgi:hypothetical protein